MYNYYLTRKNIIIDMQIFKPNSDKSYQGIYCTDGMYSSYNLIYYYDCDSWKRGMWYNEIHYLFRLKPWRSQVKKITEVDNSD